MSNLRDRARGNEVEQAPEQDVDMKGQIAQMEKAFQAAMPRGVEATQLVRDALTCLRRTPKLAECSPDTVLGALMTCAQLGLRPGVLGHAWVLPFWDGRARRTNAQLIIGYQGLIELAHRSGNVQSVMARTVYEADEFDYEFGLDEFLKHKPHREEDPGRATHYYALVKLTSGGSAFIVMTRREAEMHRDEHAMAKNKQGQVVGPWRDDFDAMAMKTCVIKLSKWMPKSADMAMAIEADESIRVDLTPDRQPDEVSHQVVQGTVRDTTTESPSEPPVDEQPPTPTTTTPPAPEQLSTADTTPTVDDTSALKAEIFTILEPVGYDDWKIEDAFRQNGDGDWSRATVEQLARFRRWALDEVDRIVNPEPAGDDS